MEFTSSQNTSLGQRLQTYLVERDAYQNINGQANFSPDVEENLFELAQNVNYPPEDFIDLAEASLNKHLNESQSLVVFWSWLKDQACSLVKVENGQMNFYADSVKIDITKHTKALKVALTPDIIELIKAEKTLIFERTRLALEEVRDGITDFPLTNVYALNSETSLNPFLNKGSGQDLGTSFDE